MNDQRVNLVSTEFKPSNDFILVNPEELTTEKTTDAGIVLQLKPQRSTERPTSGNVLDVGEKIEDIKSGDFVVWPETDGIDIEFLDGNFVLLQKRSILGIKKVKK